MSEIDISRAELVAIVGDALNDARMRGDDLPAAALAAIEAAGCVVVPRESTYAMDDAGHLHISERMCFDGFVSASVIYDAMLAANPLAKGCD